MPKGAYPLPQTKNVIPLDIAVNGVVALRLDVMAQDAGKSRKQYVNELFMAAYSARVDAEKGDKELNAAVNGAPPPAREGEAAALKQMLTALQENYRALQAELETARKASAASQSAELLEVRRKLIEMGQEVARTEAAHKTEIDTLSAAHVKALEALRAELKTVPDDSKALVELRLEIERRNEELEDAAAALNQHKSVADGARKACADLHGEVAVLKRGLEAAGKENADLRARIEEYQAARADLTKLIAEKDGELETRRNTIKHLTATNMDLMRQLKEAGDLAKKWEAMGGERPLRFLPQTDDFAKVWGALDALRADVTRLQEQMAGFAIPESVDPQKEAAALDTATVKLIRGLAAAMKSNAEIAKMTGVGLGAVKIVASKKKGVAA